MAAPSNRYRSNGAIDNAYLAFLEREKAAVDKKSSSQVDHAGTTYEDNSKVGAGVGSQ